MMSPAMPTGDQPGGRPDTTACLARKLAAFGLALAVLGGLAGCAAAPPGANNPETHPGAALVPGGGAPGLNGPFHMQSEYNS